MRRSGLAVLHATIEAIQRRKGIIGSVCLLRALPPSATKYKISHLAKRLSDRVLRQIVKTSAKAYGRYLISVSHTESVICVCGFRCPETGPDIIGFGVDIEECERSVDHRLKMRICDAHERRLMKATRMNVLAAWTIKEAAFKACLENVKSVVSQYKIRRINKGCATVVFKGRHVEVFYFKTAAVYGAIAFLTSR